MADVHINDVDWLNLENSALFFIPKLARLISLHQLTNIRIAETAKSASTDNGGSVSPLSQQIVADVARIRKPVTHSKAKNIIRSVANLTGSNEISDADIVSAIFQIRDPKIVVGNCNTEDFNKFIADLSGKSDVSERAMHYAFEGGRITGAIISRIHGVLSENYGMSTPLNQFSSSSSGGGKRVPSARAIPFTHDDLLLPLPEDHPWKKKIGTNGH